jgi:hypothetical protein
VASLSGALQVERDVAEAGRLEGLDDPHAMPQDLPDAVGVRLHPGQVATLVAHAQLRVARLRVRSDSSACSIRRSASAVTGTP